MTSLIALLGVLAPIVIAAVSRLPAFSRDGRARSAIKLDLELMAALPTDDPSRAVLQKSISSRVEDMVDRRGRPLPPDVLLQVALCSYTAGAAAIIWLGVNGSDKYKGHVGDLVLFLVGLVGIAASIFFFIAWCVVRVVLRWRQRRESTAETDGELIADLTTLE